MQQTVPTGEPGEACGIGLKTTAPGVWGQGGQTLGFLSVVDSSAGHQLSWIGWGNSSLNPMALAPGGIVAALRAGGLICFDRSWNAPVPDLSEAEY